MYTDWPSYVEWASSSTNKFAVHAIVVSGDSAVLTSGWQATIMVGLFTDLAETAI